MRKYEYLIGAAMLTAGCGGAEPFAFRRYEPHNAELHVYNGKPSIALPTKVEIVTDGYDIDCTESQIKLPPALDKKRYCSNTREKGKVEPFVYTTYRQEMIEALQCIYRDLFTFEVKEEKEAKLQMQTLFLGGHSLSNVGGTTSSWEDGEFITYVFNDNTVKKVNFYDTVMVATHELGHALISLTLYQVGETEGRRIMQKTYGLDSHGHDMKNKSIMSSTGAFDSLNFSQNTANFIADYTDLSKTGLTKSEVVVRLTTIDDRCATEIDIAKKIAHLLSELN